MRAAAPLSRYEKRRPAFNAVGNLTPAPCDYPPTTTSLIWITGLVWLV